MAVVIERVSSSQVYDITLWVLDNTERLRKLKLVLGNLVSEQKPMAVTAFA